MTQHRPLNSWHTYLRIRQCTIPGCDRWYIGAFPEYYCPGHRSARARNLRGNGGKRSSFSMEQILEIRYRYLREPARDIARDFGCSVGTVYRLQHQTPKNLRVT